jgi:undecaprenyl-diphosphatase
MTVFQAIILGIVQGLTEFIPISSSGHLVMVPWLLKWELEPNSTFVFDVLVQWGTLLALVIYFRRDIASISSAVIAGLRNSEVRSNPEYRLAWLILLSTLPAISVGLLLKSLVQDAISSPLWVSIFLLFTGALLFSAEKLGSRSKLMGDMPRRDALMIGIFQVLSLFPGISRSGATISAGMFTGLRREDAARYSFLMATPIMIAAGIVALIDMAGLENAVPLFGSLIVGFFVAALVGYLAIHWLLRYLREHSLTVFSIYCIVIGLMGMLLVALNA